MSEHAKDINDSDFNSLVIEASKSKPVFIDFWAEWCTPCKAFSPVVEQVASEMSDKVTFFKMDTDTNPSTPGQLGIMAIPTFVIYKDGEVAFRDAGFRNHEDLTQLINDVIAGNAVASA